MERFALLIDSSNVKDLRDLPGARRDIDNWKDYLTSKLGGSWIYSSNEKESQIIIRKKPMSDEVTRLLEANKSKYCFVAFAGHGFHDIKSGDYVCLNDFNHKCHLSILKPKGARGTLVVDACRGYEDAHIATTAERLDESRTHIAIANEARTYLQEKRATKILSFSDFFYNRFGELLEQCGTGIVTMLSCAKGEGADDIKVDGEEVGGIYTTLLMRSAERWEDRTFNSSVYTTKEAHNDAAIYMKQNFPQQNPEYSPVSLVYPFALK